uniref:RNA-directed RNA polymerase catalytic subunit n=1 Tax=Varroa orthomyxovirus-1 TaxID=2510845 RepID=A0A8K1V7F5_9ORTO|nr:MAG: polymerase subunit PB1 [Varroa orthomyxovirus-1]
MNLFTPIEGLSLTETQEQLYAYTGPPPVRYGTRTKPVLDNVSRPYSYFKADGSLPNIKELKTGRKPKEEINVEGPSSGYHHDSVIKFSKDFHRKYQHVFSKLKTWIEKDLPKCSYNVLAKGRQTYSFIQERNVPAAMALDETVEFLESNLGYRIGKSLLSYLQAVIDVLAMETTRKEQKFYKKGKISDDETTTSEEESDDEGKPGPSKVMKRQPQEKVVKKITIITQESLLLHASRLGTMWKHFERGRLNGRTIATPSMLLRGFVKLVEDAATVILEDIDSSGLPVGGEEKLAKLQSKLSSDRSPVTGELSGDQEKFNECLDPDAMRLMWTVFLQETGVEEWMIELFNVPFLLFKSKVADLGEGLTYQCGKMTKVFPFGELESEYDYLKALLVPKEKLHGQNISCTLGMFMGMYNLTSTLLALIAADRPELPGNHVESSDDFIHWFYVKDMDTLFSQAETLRLNFKLVGVNMSPSKCVLIVPAGTGEFNSKYHNGDFVGNVATDLPSLVPSGKNPSTDLAMGLSVLKHSFNTGQMCIGTISLCLRIFIKAYQYAYLAMGQTKRTRFFLENDLPVLLTNQGAKSVHSVSTLHLDEIALREHLGLLDTRQISILLNPENSLVQTNEPMVSFRPENKMPVVIEDNSVGSIYKYQFTRNRTILNRPNRNQLKKEEEYQQMCGALEQAYPELLVSNVGIPGTVNEALYNRIFTLIERSNLPEETKKLLREKLDS